MRYTLVNRHPGSMDSFAELLRRHRAAAGLTQEDLAERAGLSVRGVSDLERGLRPHPRPDTVRRLADALRLSDANRRDLGAAATPAPTSPFDTPLPPTVTRMAAIGLVGRSRALDVLLDALPDGGSAGGQTVLVGGEAGVGKTRLAAEVAQVAHSRGTLVLWGTSYAQEGEGPFGCIVEALDRALAGQARPGRGAVAGRYPVLARLIPALLFESAPATADAGGEPGRLAAEVVHLLEDLSGGGPLLLVFDDLHLADVDSIHLVHHLARQAGGRPWTLIGTYREEGVAPGSDLQGLIADTARERLLASLDLLRLPPSDCDDLARSLLPGYPIEPAVLVSLYRRSLGNPLFLQELVRAERDDGTIRLVEGQWRASGPGEPTVPRGVRELIAARVDRMGETVRDVLALAALAGSDCSLDLLRAASRDWIPDDVFLAALDRALTGRILDEQGDGYVFHHPLMRLALTERLPRHRRAQLHGLLAAAIERRDPDDAERLAFHYRAAGDLGKAMIYLLGAGERAEGVFAHDTAEGHFRTLLATAEACGDLGYRAAAQERLGRVLATTGRYDEALVMLEAAASACNDAESTGRIEAMIGGVHLGLGTPDQGIARVRPVLDRLESVVSAPILLTLYGTLGSLLFVLGRHDEQIAVARRAVDLAEVEGGARLRAATKAQYGLALLTVWRRDEGWRVLEEAASLAESVDDLATLGTALNNAAWVHEIRGEMGQSAALFRRALEAARRLGNPIQVAFFTNALGRNAFWAGDWHQARVHLQDAERMSRAAGRSWLSPYPLLELGRLSLATGDERAAAEHLETALALAEGHADRQASGTARALLAELSIRQGRPEHAVSLVAAAGVRTDWDPDTVDAPLTLPLVLAWALSRTGEMRSARDLVGRVLDQARRGGELMVLADALRLQGLIVLETDRGAAVRAFEEGAALARRLGYRYAEARTLRAWSRACARNGDAEAARQRLEAGLDIFRRLGATASIAETERLLAELKRRGEE